MRAELRVDEAALERLVAAGVLDREEEEEQEEEKKAEEEERARPDTPAEESAPFLGTRGARLRRSWKKVWRKINGDQEGTCESLKGASSYVSAVCLAVKLDIVPN